MSKSKKINKIILDDHGLAVLTNLLTKTAKDYGQTQQLRERIARVLEDHIDTEMVDPVYYRTASKEVQKLPPVENKAPAEPRLHTRQRERTLTDDDRARLEAVLAQAARDRTHNPYHSTARTLWLMFDNDTFHQLPPTLADLDKALSEVEAFLHLRQKTNMRLFARPGNTTLHLRSEHWDDCKSKVQAWLMANMDRTIPEETLAQN